MNILRPGQDGYAEEVAGFQTAVPSSPTAVVAAENAEDVAAAVRHATEHRLSVAVQATGHGLTAGTEGVLISTRRMTGVEIDPDAKTARVEAGVRCVTLAFSRWDWHGSDGKNFVQGKKDIPLLDRAVTALVSDLHERGLENDVSVIVWGEFGRTPRINSQASRDHWPQLSCALMAGGGMKTGQVIGSSNRLAERAASRPVTHQDIFATLYKNLGIDSSAIREYDANGRPHYPLEADAKPIKELV